MRLKPAVFVTAAFFALLAPMCADDNDKSNHTITLLCDQHGFGGRPAGPTVLDLNEAEGVVTIHWGGVIHPAEVRDWASSTVPLGSVFATDE